MCICVYGVLVGFRDGKDGDEVELKFQVQTER